MDADAALDPQPAAPPPPDDPLPPLGDDAHAGAHAHGLPAMMAGLEGLLNNLVPGAGVQIGGGVIHGELPDFGIQAPPGVRAVIDGAAGNVPPCGACGSPAARYRCTRCGVQRYCSAECQRQHFEGHRKNCRHVSRGRKSVEKSLSSLRSAMEEDRGGMSVYLAAHATASEMVKHAVSLVRTGHGECPTLRAGAGYYREALRWCVEPMRVRPGGYLKSPGMETNVVLLLYALGADGGTVEGWHAITERPDERERLSGLLGDDPDEKAKVLGRLFLAEEEREGLVSPGSCLHFLGLFDAMRSMAAYRADSARASALRPLLPADVRRRVLPYLGGREHGSDVSDIAPRIWRALGPFLTVPGRLREVVHLRDSVPFSPWHAPRLFVEGGSGDRPPLVEGWRMVQELFLQSPGVSDVLEEFLPRGRYGHSAGREKTREKRKEAESSDLGS